MRMFAAMMAIAIAAPVHADAWARGRGRTYVHLGIAAMNADTAFDPSGERVPFPGRGSRRSRANLYAEIGLTGALTFVANTPYERVTSRGLFNDFTTAGGGDLDLRLRLTRQTAAGAFALEGGAYLPLGYDRSAFPQLGTGTIDPIVNAAYGTSISALPEGFVSAQIGYRSRGGGVSDELPYSVKAGAFFHPRVGTFVAIRGWEGRGDFRRIDPSFALTAADSESLSAGGEMYVRLTPRFHINAGWSRPVRGRNHAIGNEWSVGIAVKNR